MKNFNQKVQEQFDRMSSQGKLFRVALTGHDVWDKYLASFDNDPKFRDPASSEHNCNHCKNFIRRYGNIVAIIDNTIVSMFDVEADDEYTPVAKALSAYIKSSVIKEVFFETFEELNSLPYESCNKKAEVFRLGIDKNVKRYTKEEAEKYGVVTENETRTFNHMHLSLNKMFVDMSGKSVESIMGSFRESKEVFKRAMDTIPLDTLNLVRDLINQGSLLDGTTHLGKVELMISLKSVYDTLADKQKDNWCWLTSFKLPIAKFRNELIGVLCTELAEGKEINDSCKTWNIRVDPTNYMKAVAPITKRQIEEAKAFVEANGYVESFNRRFANMDDIKISEIKHVNAGKNEGIKGVSIFDTVKPVASRHKRNEFEGIEEVTIDNFMENILPQCTSVEALLLNKHDGHMVSLTTSNVLDSKPLFKWDNNFSWTFAGNIAGKSMIKSAVKSAGGKVNGVLRFSIMWNEDGKEVLDFDAHAVEPDGNHIYFGHCKETNSTMSGMLDVDMIRPRNLGVENIVWSDLKRMKNGTYNFSIENFDGGANKGFKAEIEVDGEIYSYEYNRTVGLKKAVLIATVTLNNGVFTINHDLPEVESSSKAIYGLNTNEFHRVRLVCSSPNHWGDNKVGNKHYMFMLEDCKCPTAIRSFHNENLLPELAEHRKVLEVLGNTNMIEPSDNQLSGLGFNATVRDELVVKLGGNFKRIVKIKF